MEWSFTEKAQIISFNSAQGSGRSPELFPTSGIHSERNSPDDKQGGTSHHFRARNHPQAVKISPVSSHSNQTVMSADVSPRSCSSSEANAAVCSKSAGVASIVPPPVCSLIPFNSDNAFGSTDLRAPATSSHGRPSQLTIFYDGLVSVYDDIPFEKVQALMVLIGNHESTNINARSPMPEVQPIILPMPPSVEHTAAYAYACDPPPGSSSRSRMSNSALEVKPAEASTPPNNKGFEPEPPGEVALHECGDISTQPSGVELGWRASLAMRMGKRRRAAKPPPR